MTIPGGLSLRAGYVLTLSQLFGQKPHTIIACGLSCSWSKEIEVPLGEDPSLVGDAIHTAVTDWLEHPCGADVGSDMPVACGSTFAREDGVSFECGVIGDHDDHRVHDFRWSRSGRWLS